MAKLNTFPTNIGDRVAFSAKFLRSIGDHRRGNMRGTVIDFSGDPNGHFCIAYIHWDGFDPPPIGPDGREEGGVNTKNLCVIKHIATEATLAGVIPQNGWAKTL